MHELLNLINNYCSDLYNKYNFRFVDAVVSESNGNAAIVLENDDINLRCIRDKGQLFLYFQSKYYKKKDDEYSIDLVRQLMSGDEDYRSEPNEKNDTFLANHLGEILKLFDADAIGQTIEKLKALRQKRTKLLFG